MKMIIIKSTTFLLIVLWVYAALSKLLDFEQSRRQMLNQVFPISMAHILLWLVPISEFVAAGLLCFERTRRAGLKLSILLLLLFTAYIILVMLNVFGRVPCSCGGILEKMSWGQHLLFNLFCVILSVFALLFYPRTSHATNRDPGNGSGWRTTASDKKPAGVQRSNGRNNNEKLPRIRAPADESDSIPN